MVVARTRIKLRELKEKATGKRQSVTLRHTLNDADVKKVNENTHLLSYHQNTAINKGG